MIKIVVIIRELGDCLCNLKPKFMSWNRKNNPKKDSTEFVDLRVKPLETKPSEDKEGVFKTISDALFKTEINYGMLETDCDLAKEDVHHCGADADIDMSIDSKDL